MKQLDNKEKKTYSSFSGLSIRFCCCRTLRERLSEFILNFKLNRQTSNCKSILWIAIFQCFVSKQKKNNSDENTLLYVQFSNLYFDCFFTVKTSLLYWEETLSQCARQLIFLNMTHWLILSIMNLNNILCIHNAYESHKSYPDI